MLSDNYPEIFRGGGQPSSREDGMAQIAQWKAWVEGLGENVVNPGTPLKDTKIVTSDDVQEERSPNAMKGFAVVKAENIEAAIDIAQSDPFLNNAGTIRVSEMVAMK